MRVNWNASVHWLSSVIVQSDNLNHLTNVQAILRWLVTPGADVFVVYDGPSGAGFERPGTRVTVKVRETLDF